MTPTLKKIIILLIIGILIFVVYAIFIKKTPIVDQLVSNGATTGDAQILGNQISQALLRIEQIKLDKGIFDNTLYRSLVDRSKPIGSEPIGRTNPFAPIGDVSSITSTVRNTSGTSTASSQKTATGTTSTSTSSKSI